MGQRIAGLSRASAWPAGPQGSLSKASAWPQGLRLPAGPQHGSRGQRRGLRASAWPAEHGQQDRGPQPQQGLSIKQMGSKAPAAGPAGQQGQRGHRASGARYRPSWYSVHHVRLYSTTYTRKGPAENWSQQGLTQSISAHTNTLTIIPSRTRHPDRARRSTVANSLSCSRRFMLHRPSGSPL